MIERIRSLEDKIKELEIRMEQLDEKIKKAIEITIQLSEEHVKVEKALHAEMVHNYNKLAQHIS